MSLTEKPAKTSKRIWTSEITNLLFKLLVERFGPHSEWECETTPSRNNEEYNEFLEAFAKAIGATGSAAVKMQITAALGKCVEQRAFVIASAAALEYGFISDEEFRDRKSVV